MKKSTTVPQVLKLTFNGSFRVLSARDTSVRCGPHKMPRTIKYTTVIGSRPDLLDHRSFIIDWRDISKAVAYHYRYVNQFPSCETFSSEILGIIETLLEGRCVSISVDVSIEGLPAHMTADWVADDEESVLKDVQGSALFTPADGRVINDLINPEPDGNLLGNSRSRSIQLSGREPVKIEYGKKKSILLSGREPVSIEYETHAEKDDLTSNGSRIPSIVHGREGFMMT